MNVFTAEDFGRAADHIRAHARPLERSLFQFRFDDGPANAVRSELRAYRNADGGFGQGLEPDVRTPASSVYLTTIALHVLREIGADPDDSLVRGALEFLSATYDAEGLVWPMLPEAAQDAPHAPWWNDRGGDGPFKRLDETFGGFRIMPRARAVDLILHFDHDLGGHLGTVIEDTLAAIAAATKDDLAGGGGTFTYAAGLVENPALATGQVAAARDNLAARLPEVLVTDPQEWVRFGAAPVTILPAPSGFTDAVRHHIDLHLDFLMDHRKDHGGWDPLWDWMGDFPDVWEGARWEWSGWVTLETLSSLRAYGRL